MAAFHRPIADVLCNSISQKLTDFFPKLRCHFSPSLGKYAVGVVHIFGADHWHDGWGKKKLHCWVDMVRSKLLD